MPPSGQAGIGFAAPSDPRGPDPHSIDLILGSVMSAPAALSVLLANVFSSPNAPQPTPLLLILA